MVCLIFERNGFSAVRCHCCYYDEYWMVKIDLSNLQCDSSHAWIWLLWFLAESNPGLIAKWFLSGQIVSTGTSQPSDFYQPQFMKYTFIYLLSFKFGPPDFNQTAFTSSVCSVYWLRTVGFSDARESRSVDKCSCLHIFKT